MKHLSHLAASVVGLALFALAVPGAFAQQPAQQRPAQPRPAQPAPAAPAQARPLPPKGTDIVIIDVGTIERNSLVHKAYRTQEERHRTAQQTEEIKLDNELRAADQELAQQRTILSPEAFNTRRRDLEKRIADTTQGVQNRRKEIGDAFVSAFNRIQATVGEVVKEIAAENDYKVVLARQVVVVSQDAVDITDEVINRLNKKMTTINVAIPARR